MAIRDEVREEIKKQQMERLETHRLNVEGMERAFLLCDMIEMFDNDIDELLEFQYHLDESGRHGVLFMYLYSFLVEDESTSVGGISKQTYCKYIVNADGLRFDQDEKGRLRIQHLIENLWVPTEEWEEWKTNGGDRGGKDEPNTTEKS